MEFDDFLRLVRDKIQTIIVIVMLFFIISAAFTFIQPLKYGSESKVLVVLNNSKGVDPYVVSKSNEYISTILSEIVKSSNFYFEVMKSGFNVEGSYFRGDNRSQIQKWTKTVYARQVNDTGIISISVFHTSKSQADQISRAVNYVLKTNHSNYHGNGDDVSIKVIDEPIVSDYPIKPNVLMNLILGLVLGFISALIYIYFFPSRTHDIRIIPGRRKKIQTLKNDWQKASKMTSPNISQYNSIEHKLYQANNVNLDNNVQNNQVSQGNNQINQNQNNSSESSQNYNSNIKGNMNNILNR